MLDFRTDPEPREDGPGRERGEHVRPRRPSRRPAGHGGFGRRSGGGAERAAGQLAPVVGRHVGERDGRVFRGQAARLGSDGQSAVRERRERRHVLDGAG